MGWPPSQCSKQWRWGLEGGLVGLEEVWRRGRMKDNRHTESLRMHALHALLLCEFSVHHAAKIAPS